MVADLLVLPRASGVPARLILLLALVAPVGHAQDEARVLDELRACSALPGDSARLACFDALARGVAGGEAAGSAPAVAPAERERTAATPPPPPRAAESFGLPAEPEPRARREPEGEELTSSVAALREIQPGRLEVTLANGQVWRQVNTERYALAMGDEVRIYPTRFGSYYRLVAKRLRSFVQVERVR